PGRDFCARPLHPVVNAATVHSFLRRNSTLSRNRIRTPMPPRLPHRSAFLAPNVQTTPMSRRLLPRLAALALVLAVVAPARADTALTADELLLLETLDPQLAQECLQAAQQLDGWRKDAEAVRRVLAAAKKGPDAPPPAKEDVDRAWKVAEALARR